MSNRPTNLSDLVVVIAGASSGFGRGAAQELAAHGAKVVVAATKAAVLSLSRSLNQELRLAGEGDIKVGTIMPWAVDTPWWRHAANYTGHAPRMAMMDDPQIVIDAIVKACIHPDEEQAVGWKAKGSDIMHHVFPDLTERMSANVARSEADKAMLAPHTTGALYEPMSDGLKIGGHIRERMQQEDKG